MPFLAVALRENDVDAQGGRTVENQGFGPALNISLSYYWDGRRHTRQIPPLGIGEKRTSLDAEIRTALAHVAGVEIVYESLSGKRYKTTVSSTDGTRFHRL